MDYRQTSELVNYLHPSEIDHYGVLVLPHSPPYPALKSGVMYEDIQSTP